MQGVASPTRTIRSPGPAGEGWTGLPAGSCRWRVRTGNGRGRPVRDGVTDILHLRYRVDAPAAYGCSRVPDGRPGDGAGPTTTNSRHAEGSINAVRASGLSRAEVSPSFHATRS